MAEIHRLVTDNLIVILEEIQLYIKRLEYSCRSKGIISAREIKWQEGFPCICKGTCLMTSMVNRNEVHKLADVII
jgi:hypothetical protein